MAVRGVGDGRWEERITEGKEEEEEAKENEEGGGREGKKKGRDDHVIVKNLGL